MKNIIKNDKIYWTIELPITKENLFLALDWNDIDISVNNIDNIINTISTNVYTVFNPDISSFITAALDSVSYLSTINGLYNQESFGISTIRINGKEYWGTLNLNFILYTSSLVNTFNGQDGDISSVLIGITLDNQHILSSQTVNINDVFLQNEFFIRSINNHLTGDINGNIDVLSSIEIDEKIYSNLNNNYLITIPDNFDKNLYKKDGEILSLAVISSLTDPSDNTILNILTFNNYHQISARILQNVESIFYNIIDWICITNLNYNIILPTTATLNNNTLTITSPSAGIIYFISLV